MLRINEVRGKTVTFSGVPVKMPSWASAGMVHVELGKLPRVRVSLLVHCRGGEEAFCSVFAEVTEMPLYGIVDCNRQLL